MTCFETGSNHRLTYVTESTFGTTPASPVMKPVRFTTLSLKGARDAFQSAEIRSDQQISDLRLGQKSVTGDVAFELSYGAFDDLLEAVLGGTWTVADTDTGTDWEVTAANTFTKTSHGLTVATDDVIEVTGFSTNANNNGKFKVASVTANTIVVTESKLTVEGSGDSVTVDVINGGTLTGGTNTPSFSMERGFLGTTDFEVFTGVTVNTLTLTIVPNGIVTGTFSFLGSSTSTATSTIAGSSITPAPTFSPMDSFNGALTIDAGSVPVSAIELTLTRNITEARTIGNDFVECLVPGRNDLTGSFTAYFEDLDLIDAFNAETEQEIVVTVADAAGAGANSYTFTIPRTKLTDNDHPIDNEQSVLQTCPFQALLDSVSSTNITITR